MINIKQNKGITLVTLVITIIILLILTGTTIYNFSISNEASYYNKMVSDIELLNDKILVYYNKYGEIPKTNKSITINDLQYYEIDLPKLNDITLNYGNDYGKKGRLKSISDLYVVNSNLDIYYLKGIEKSGEIYHSKNDSSQANIQEAQYLEIEYIESTGIQYINTGYIPKSNTIINVYFKTTKQSGEPFTSLFGAQSSSGEPQRAYILFGKTNNIQVNIPRNSIEYACLNKNGTFEKNTGSSDPYWNSNKAKYSLDFMKKSVTIDDITWDLSTYFTGDIIDSEYPLFLLTRNTKGVADSDYSKGYVYGLTIYEDNVLVHEFVPCLDINNIACLYDKVEGEYYYNQGTGDFIAGPEI